MRTLLVRNPASGSSRGSNLAEVEESLRRLGPLDILESPSREALRAGIADAAADVDLVIIAGGDGTVGDVVDALEARLDDLLFSVLPTGTGNDLARTLDLPPDAKACAAALDPRALRTLDVGRASGGGRARLFVNACMGGFPVEVDGAIGDDDKRRLGPLAFWLGGVKAAADLQRATVWVDGHEVPDCVAVGVGNGRSAGGGIEVWPDADPSDGLLDVCALGAPGALDAARVALRIVRGRHGDLDAVYTTRAAHVTIEARPEVEFNVDGEVPGFPTPVEFAVAGTIRMLVCG